MNVPSPCDKDCPNRTPTCRLSCNKYKLYEVIKARDYEKRREACKAKELECQYYISRHKRLKQRYG